MTSPLDQARLPTPEDDSAQLAAELRDITLRGKDAERLIGDIKGARTLHGLFRKYGARYQGTKEFEADLVPLCSRKIKELADVDPQAAALFMNIGLKATHQNAQAEERLMKLAGLGHKEESGPTTVNINNTYAEKVLNIVDPVRGGHGRTLEDQETLNDAARRLLGVGKAINSATIGVGASAHVEESPRRRPLLNADPSGGLERNPGPDDGEAKPSADPEPPSSGW